MDNHEQVPGRQAEGARAPAGTIKSDTPLLLPAYPRPDASPDSIAIETRIIDGHDVVLAFTNLAKLVAALGEHQPWIGLRAGMVKAMLPGHVVVIDPEGTCEVTWDAAKLAQLEAAGRRDGDA
jgi:hypothetical protein